MQGTWVVSPPNYYKWERQEKSREERRFGELGHVKKIEKVFIENRRNIGYRGVRQRLLREGFDLSEYRVRRIMKENGFYPETLKKYKPCHNGKQDGMSFENKVKQQFNARTQNQIWAGDITYIKTSLGWVYLSVVLDLYNREVIGYTTSKNIDTELVKRSLGNAILKNGTKEGLIFHSDRGSQYASKGFQEMLRINGINGSMSRPACPYDNSCVESIFATLKKEQIYKRKFDTMEEVQRDVFEYIELFYNRKRMHSHLGYMSPVEYRLKQMDLSA